MERTFDRTLLIRHVALCAAAIAAFFLRSELSIGYTALAIVCSSALLNFLAFAFRTRRALARACWLASPVIGVGSWASLIAVTNGVSSPFVAGLWLEVVLSAMALRRAGVVIVTSGAIAALWGQQLWHGIGGATHALILQSGFLFVMGAATFLVTRRWIRMQRDLSLRYRELEGRLREMDRRLEDERTLGTLGENVGRLAHGLKNAVHSLRGFISLIEPRLPEGRGGHAALDGLRAAIDDLEALARLSLGGGGPEGTEGRRAETSCPEDCVERAVREMLLSHREVHWVRKSDGSTTRLPIPPADLHEVLIILLRNAAEAMDAPGEVSIETRSTGSGLCVSIRDGGAGLPPAAVPRIFEPGYTTKPDGSGYGLFLARRILEKHGGCLVAKPNGDAGAVFELTLPATPAEQGPAAVEETRR